MPMATMKALSGRNEKKRNEIKKEIFVSNGKEKNEVGREVDVIYVLKRDADRMKLLVFNNLLLNKNYRMVSANTHDHCVAIPISRKITTEEILEKKDWLVEGIGKQWCPYSTAVLGNYSTSIRRKQQPSSLTLVQEAIQTSIIETLQKHYPKKEVPLSSLLLSKSILCSDLLNTNTSICPKKIELFGDDRTLILPSKAFQGKEFDTFILQHVGKEEGWNIKEILEEFRLVLWKTLSEYYGGCPRIVRRGSIDPKSKIRQSGHIILWPPELLILQKQQAENNSNNNNIHPFKAAGWICVTEQGIRQSLDLTKVMFSRGNITEKIRFGTICVKKGDVVLDMYAGIGYYTLPAILKGKASYVHACEWNSQAFVALQHNLQDNSIPKNKIELCFGDCRKMLFMNENKFNRVCLGLLPSSEGGWETAVRALKRPEGGWLHIHGNVPDKEITVWSTWLCYELHRILTQQKQEENNNWVVWCDHIEKVKSFAPTVSHYVADVYMGISQNFQSNYQNTTTATTSIGYFDTNGNFNTKNDNVINIKIPSCALYANTEGPLSSQEWMK